MELIKDIPQKCFDCPGFQEKMAVADNIEHIISLKGIAKICPEYRDAHNDICIFDAMRQQYGLLPDAGIID